MDGTIEGAADPGGHGGAGQGAGGGSTYVGVAQGSAYTHGSRMGWHGGIGWIAQTGGSHGS